MTSRLADSDNYQAEFVDFLLDCEALTFGDFVTKSGRQTPFFVNTGKFDSGERISRLGEFYAAHAVECGVAECNSVFGPAYKGIPLAVSTAIALTTKHNITAGYSFDRKEEKDHGDKGNIVGYQLRENDRVVIVEDVITAGTTLRHIVPYLRELAKIEVTGVVLAVDRCEKGSGESSAVSEIQSQLNIPIYPVVTIHQIVDYLSSDQAGERKLSADLLARIGQYLAEFGAT